MNEISLPQYKSKRIIVYFNNHKDTQIIHSNCITQEYDNGKDEGME